MILVTLGTQDKKFYRLLDMVEESIKNGIIKEEVVVQAGCSSDYKSSNMKIFNLISIDKFDELIDKCDILITHGGVGSIISGLKNNKKVIAVPRLKKYNEHVNDHQLQIIENFSNNGYILYLSEKDNLNDLLEECKYFKPKKYKSNNKNFLALLDKYIDN